MFSLDSVLATDIQERISLDPRAQNFEIIRPESTSPKATIAEIERMARDTVAARLLIIDVRSYTLPPLQHAYNKVVGYNRKDMNLLCHSVLIGDGPVNLFRAGKALHVFLPHLARHRLDYYPAVFFYDPFAHYAEGERKIAGIDGRPEVPRYIPKRLERIFAGQSTLLIAAREYLRAARVPPEKRAEARQRRQAKLAKFYRKRIAEEFPHHKEQLESWLTKDGYVLAGEALRLHIYPLFFEDWVLELMFRARKAAP